MTKFIKPINLAKQSIQAKKIDIKKEMGAIKVKDTDQKPLPFVEYPLIRDAFPGKSKGHKTDLKIPNTKKEIVTTQTPISTVLNICLKGFIVCAAIYASIDYGCWKRTYLEPLENEIQATKAVGEDRPSRWDVFANYFAGRS